MPDSQCAAHALHQRAVRLSFTPPPITTHTHPPHAPLARRPPPPTSSRRPRRGQVLVYMAVAKKGDKPTDGITDRNPEGLTAATGKWAPQVRLPPLHRPAQHDITP